MSRRRPFAKPSPRSRLRRRAPWILGAILALCGIGGIAHAFWQSTNNGNFAAAAADSLAQGARPTAVATQTTVAVNWTASSTINGRSVTGYTVARYNAATGGTRTSATGGCAGTVTGTGCTEQSVAAGTWYYAVTPTLSLWTGTESPRGAGATTDSPPTVAVSAISPSPNGAGYDNTSPVAVNLLATDTGSGVASITYWVDSGTHTTVNATTATATVTGDGTHTVSYFGTNSVGSAGTTQTRTVKIDTIAPTVPAPTVTAGYYTTLSVPIGLGTATDAGSGGNAGTIVVQRDQTALTGGGCGTFPGTYPTTVTLNGGNDTSVASGLCYQYREQEADNAGNVGASPGSGIARIDTSAPTVPTLSYSALSNISVTGATVYYRPTATSGGFTVTAAATDPESGVTGYAFPSLGTDWSVTGTGATRTYGWTSANPVTTSGNLSVTATNGAGLNSSGTGATNPFTPTADSTGPVAASATVVDATAKQDGFIHQNGSFLIYANVSDAGSGVSTVAANISAISNTPSTALAPCTSGCVVKGVTYGYKSAQQTAKNPLPAGAYNYTITATDNVANTTTSAGFPITADNTGPTVTTITSGNNDGMVTAGDFLAVTYNKPIAPASVNTTAGAATLTFSESAPDDVMVSIVGLMAPSDTGISKADWVAKNSSVTCAGTSSVSGSTVTWTATGACGANLKSGASGTLVFNPDITTAGVEDFAGNTPTGTKTYTAQLF